MQTTTRNANLTDMVALLRDHHARKVDVVAPASAVRAVEGDLVIRGTEAILSDEGVTTADGTYTPTAVCDEGLAEKLAVPVAYLKRLRETRPDLYDANVNGFLHGRRPKVRNNGTPEGEVIRPGIPADPRSFLVRCLRGDDGETGIARAFLSDRYAVMDNLDVLLATLDGMRDAGVATEIDGLDLTDRRMVVRVKCPEVSALAPALLAGYRSPFTGQSGSDNPTVWAGFQVSNSEVGGGAFSITPRLVVQVCNNGMTITKDAVQKVHLGGRLDAGVIRWGADTQEAAVALVKKQTRDAVTTFLSPEYLTRTVDALQARAGEEVQTAEVTKVLTKQARYSQADADAILDYFVRGGQTTLGGLTNAVTAYAQTVEDGDRAYDLEARATSLLGV